MPMAIFADSLHEQKIIIDTQQEKDFAQKIASFLPLSVMIEQISYAADVLFSEKEFRYIIDIPENSLVSKEQLIQALFYLIRKNKFQTITLTLHPMSVGYNLHFDFVSYWTLGKVKLHAFLLGKDRYLYHYLMEPGDRFDDIKHIHSLENIRNIFRQEGFFNAVIDHKLVRDECIKEIVVHLYLDRGPLFCFGNIQVLLNSQLPYDEELKKTIISSLKNLKKRSYNRQIINQKATEIKRYLSRQGYLQSVVELQEMIDIKKKCINLRFTIDLHERREFVFVGNSALSDHQLLDQLFLFGQSALILPHDLLTEEITKLYHAYGFLKVRIKITEEANRLFFAIEEGSVARINTLILEGNTFLSSLVLMKELAPLLKHCQATQAKINEICLFIKDRYKNSGFLDVGVCVKAINQSSGNNDDDYTLSIQIIEGEHYFFDQISCALPSGCPILDKELNVDDKTSFSYQILNEQQNRIEKHLHDYGYSGHTVEYQLKRNGSLVSVNWRCSEPLAHSFGKTIVTGSSRFPFEYLLRELTYTADMPWDPFHLKQSLLALKGLDIFDSIYLHPYQGFVPIGGNPLILRANLDDPFEVRVHAGYAAQGTLRDLHFNGTTYKLGGSLIFKNPFNCADYCIANVDFTRPYRIVEFQYWRPWIFNRPIKTLLQCYDNAFKYPSLRGLQRNLYQVTHQGFLLGLSRKWIGIEGGCSIGFEWMETVISNKAPQESEFNRHIARAINFEPNLLDVKIPYFLLEPTLFINYLDDQLYPTRGLLSVLSLKGMFPLSKRGKDTLFVRLMAEQSAFIPLSHIPIVLALRLRVGMIIFQRFNNIMPSERFYLGGAFSLRSYQNDLCPPLGIIDNGSDKPDFVPQGGKSMLNINIELRFPLYRQLNGVVFQDFGLLDGGNFFEMVKGNLLAGTGFGLRYNTPIGPIRFDIGFKWRRPAQEISPLAWFLTLGQSF